MKTSAIRSQSALGGLAPVMTALDNTQQLLEISLEHDLVAVVQNSPTRLPAIIQEQKGRDWRRRKLYIKSLWLVKLEAEYKHTIPLFWTNEHAASLLRSGFPPIYHLSDNRRP